LILFACFTNWNSCKKLFSGVPSMEILSLQMHLHGRFESFLWNSAERNWFLSRGSVLDPSGGLPTLYQEQEKRKRVLGWRRTQKDPFEGEWKRIVSWLRANPERALRRHLLGVAAPLLWTLSVVANAHPQAAGCARSEPTRLGNL
jgi:hypothetical protein